MSEKNIISPLFRTVLTLMFVLLSFNSFIPVSRGDQAEAEQGKKLFKDRACAACHTIGKGKLTGPDLAGVSERRNEEWLKKWLKSPETMLMSDPIAKEMLGIYMVPMPNQGLSDGEIDALIDYFEYEDSNKK
ncbi:MAG: c-type cytochrome [Thermodesulfobacteriota bacterium]